MVTEVSTELMKQGQHKLQIVPLTIDSGLQTHSSYATS